jgi:hypothetical protein
MTKSHLQTDYSKQFVIAIYHLGLPFALRFFPRAVGLGRAMNKKIERRKLFLLLHVFHFYSATSKKGEKNNYVILQLCYVSLSQKSRQIELHPSE